MQKDSSPFLSEPGFYLEDNRSKRALVPVSLQTLEAKHSALLPEWIIKGKKILDLGSCIGATGHWCLHYGAKHYTGVELQPEYLRKSKILLSRHWQRTRFRLVKSEISDFLMKIKKNEYDIIVMTGVLYAFLDYFSVLKNAAKGAKEWIMIESITPKRLNLLGDPLVEFIDHQTMTLPGDNQRALGMGSRVSSSALSIIMKNLGFNAPDGILHPEAIQGEHDAFNEVTNGGKFPLRFLMRFKREQTPMGDLAYELKTGKFSKPTVGHAKYRPGNKLIHGSWKFDEKVASQFDKIAHTSIPRYEEVIRMGVEIAEKAFPQKDCKILDVGSAIGQTVDTFIQNGFHDTWGVENSKAMFSKSKHPEKIILSEHFPTKQGPFHMICANWVLHFMNHRKKYLQDIYHGLMSGGYFILSEKVQATPLIEELYWDFKRKNGLSESEIKNKATAIQGVLIPYPLNWYYAELKELGFREINVINAYYHFVTILAKK